MEELTRSQIARIAIRSFKTTADALALRGFYRPSGKSGETLEQALRMLSPEIYGSMNDPKRIELKGIEYVMDRLPRGIESCNRIVLTAQEEFENTPFQAIWPLKRRRISYRVSDTEICFVVTRGLSEIYDILTHITFLNIEARKIYNRIIDDRGVPTTEWRALESFLGGRTEPAGESLDQAIWDLSILLGRTYQETRDSFGNLEKNRKAHDSNTGLFRIVYGLGSRMAAEIDSSDHALMVYFTPSLQELIGHHKYGAKWARNIQARLAELGLLERPLHIISANMHSIVNTLYGYGVVGKRREKTESEDFYDLIHHLRNRAGEVKKYAAGHGLTELADTSGAQIDCQIIDTGALDGVPLHPEVHIDPARIGTPRPVILVIDYAFGAQAFEVMDELLGLLRAGAGAAAPSIASISIMGKAGILPGKKGDILLATAHVIEGTTDNYIVANDLEKSDFPPGVDVYVGPMVTVLGTSLQNRDVLERFQTTTWKAIGLEMEGGHYQRAIGAAVIRGYIPGNLKVRYAYYASDNPLASGQTLASGSMGDDGIRPTYMISTIILEKIFAQSD